MKDFFESHSYVAISYSCPRGCIFEMYHDYVDTVRFHLMCERLHLDDSVVTHIRTVARACTRKEKLTKGPILPGGRTPLAIKEALAVISSSGVSADV